MPDDKVTPSEELGKEIIEDLVRGGLIPELRKELALAKLLAGSVSEGDWRSWIYSSQVEKQREEENDAE